MTSDGAYDDKFGLERHAMGEPFSLSAEPAAGKGQSEPLSSLYDRLPLHLPHHKIQLLSFFLSFFPYLRLLHVGGDLALRSEFLVLVGVLTPDPSSLQTGNLVHGLWRQLKTVEVKIGALPLRV
jgi:hypothetical protein